MLPAIEIARRRRLRSPARGCEPDPPQITTSSESRRWRGATSSSLAHHHHHHHHHLYHHHHYHHHPPRAAPSSGSATTATQTPHMVYRALTSQQQSNNMRLLTSSEVGPSSSDSGGLRGFRGEESRISRLAILLRGQPNERRLEGAARKARDRLDERLRAATLMAPRRAPSTVPTSVQYDLSVLFSDDEEENLWSDDEEWERRMPEWLPAGERIMPGGNSRPVSMESRPLRPREGLAKAAIEAIQRETYGTKQSSEMDREQEDCPVCLEKFVPGQALLALPCKHRYHPDCLTPWLEGHEQCPCCRAHVEGSTKRQVDKGSGSLTQSPGQGNEHMSWISALERGMSRLTFAGS